MWRGRCRPSCDGFIVCGGGGRCMRAGTQLQCVPRGSQVRPAAKPCLFSGTFDQQRRRTRCTDYTGKWDASVQELCGCLLVSRVISESGYGWISLKKKENKCGWVHLVLMEKGEQNLRSRGNENVFTEIPEIINFIRNAVLPVWQLAKIHGIITVPRFRILFTRQSEHSKYSLKWISSSSV